MLGDRILELRSMRNWSQVMLAKRLGVTKQTVSNWENGNIQPSIEMLSIFPPRYWIIQKQLFRHCTGNIPENWSCSRLLPGQG